MTTSGVASAAVRSRDVRRAPKLFPHGWVALLVLPMMVSSDYEIRLRAPDAALQGSADLAILVEVGVYAAVAAFLALQLGSPPRLRRPPSLLLAVWIFGGTLFVSAFYADYPPLAVVRGFQLLVVCALCQAVYRHATRSNLHRLCQLYVVLVSISVFVGVVHPLPRLPLQVDRFNWLYVHPVIAGTYLGASVVIVVAFLAMRRTGVEGFRWPPWVYVGLLILNTGALLATRTRGSIGGALLGCLAVLAVTSRRRLLADLAVVVAVVTLIAALQFGEQIVAFVERGESAESLATLNSRTELWSEAIRLFKERPVLGYGLAASRGLFIEKTGLGGGHNAFINVLVDAGLVGALAWVTLLVLIGGALRRLAPEPSAHRDVALLVGLLTFQVLNSLTTEGLAIPANVASTWLLVMAGWIGVLRRRLVDDASVPRVPLVSTRLDGVPGPPP